MGARFWNLSITGTIRKLEHLGLMTATDEQIEHYEWELITYRKEVDHFWQTARRTSTADYRDTSILAEKLRLSWQDQRGDRDLGPERFFGVCTFPEARRALYRKEVTRIEITLFEKPKKSGRPWGNLLVFPFYDLPGRISSLLFIGRDGIRYKDYVFRRLPLEAVSAETNSPRASEAGLHFDPVTIEHSLAEYGHRLLVIADAATATAVQLHHLQSDTLPLPIVAWSPGDDRKTELAWNMFPGCELIYWAPDLEPAIIREAARRNAKVSTVGPRESSMAEYVRDYGDRLADYCFRNNGHWAEAVERHLSQLSDKEAEEKLLALRLDAQAQDELLPFFKPRLRTKIEKVIERVPRMRHLSIADRIITERSDGLYASGRSWRPPELILGGRLKIHRVLTRAKTKQVFYSGSVYLGNEEIQFLAPKAEFDRRPLEWLQDKVSETGHLFLRINRNWNKSIIDIVTQLYPPEAAISCDSIGWDPDNEQFVLPSYSLRAGGLLRRNDPNDLPRDAPCRQWPDTEAPRELSGLELCAVHALPPESEAALWGVLTGAIANIIAPVFREPLLGVGLCGAGAESLGRTLAKAIGCCEVLIGETGQAGVLRESQILTREWDHNWPILVHASPGSTTLSAWILPKNSAFQEHNAIAPLRGYQGILQRLLGDWSVIELEQAGSLVPIVLRSLQQIVPDYLRDLCQRRFALSSEERAISQPDVTGSTQECWYRHVLADLCGYVQRAGGDPARVLLALTVTATPLPDQGRPAELVRLCVSLQTEGKLPAAVPDYVDPGKRDKSLLISGHGRQSEMLVPKAEVLRLLGLRRVRLEDPARISAVLSAAGVLRGETDEVWRVDGAWWRKEARRLSAPARMFRVRSGS